MYLKKISHRIALSFLIFFIPLYFIVFFTFMFLAEKHLTKRDHDIIENQLQIYQDLYEKEGLESLKSNILNPKLHHQSSQFLIRIFEQNQNTIFLHFPYNIKQSEKINLEKKLIQKSALWSYVASELGDADFIELKTVNLDSKLKIQIGSSTDERDLLLEKFIEIFLLILIPLIIFSIIGALTISKKILKPIEKLTQSILEIKNGQLSNRAPLPEFKDELYDLTLIFNEFIQQIEDLMRTMKETIDNIAHDLRTPLTRSRMLSEIALQKNELNELRSAAEENIENSDHVLKLIKTILEVARLDSKTLTLHKESFSVLKCMEEVFDLYDLVAEENEINLKLEYDKDLEISADRSLFKQSIANLIDNSLKYSPPQSTVICRFFKEESFCVISLKDEGIGISKVDQSRMWERLYRADRSRHMPGFGLGLSMVKVFVDSHKGSAVVKSDINKGSEFILRIPLY